MRRVERPAFPARQGPKSITIESIRDILRKDARVDGDAQRIGQHGWML